MIYTCEQCGQEFTDEDISDGRCPFCKEEVDIEDIQPFSIIDDEEDF